MNTTDIIYQRIQSLYTDIRELEQKRTTASFRPNNRHETMRLSRDILHRLQYIGALDAQLKVINGEADR
jgi:hypothetical protein